MKTTITASIQKDLGAYLSTTTFDQIFILADSNTRQHCLPLVINVPQIAEAKLITIDAGDLNKSLTQLSNIWTILSNQRATRHTLLINLGGGMVSDIGGFAAATFKRGLRTLNIPTTLMAAVDAAIGGKTGINFNGLKNEVGAFHTPIAVFISSLFLRTLDRGNILSGYAEMIKHALLEGSDTLADTLSFEPDADLHDYARLNRMMAESISVKEKIVAADPLEKSARKALNLGHTIGHALESISFADQRPLLHGCAVAHGLVCELYISYKNCGFPSSTLMNVARFIKSHYPPYPIDCSRYDALYELMTHDKKNQSNAPSFALLAQVGQPKIDQTVERALVEESLDFYQDFFGI
ncbi:MAG: 3-dehydroquinate synthase [Tannerellaceae bacterium]|jgi:3-dehydroquinate synthase|nr:3-dehydroquinate synthase [Tannerellaceae bacterium]